jgi:hypothetical protein
MSFDPSPISTLKITSFLEKDSVGKKINQKEIATIRIIKIIKNKRFPIFLLLNKRHENKAGVFDLVKLCFAFFNKKPD